MDYMCILPKIHRALISAVGNMQSLIKLIRSIN